MDASDHRETIRCPACAEEILAEAGKCKHCGEWLAEKPEPAVIEQTDKTWKGLQLAGGVMAVVAVLAIAGGAYEIGAPTAFAGLVLLLVGRGAAWWHHA